MRIRWLLIFILINCSSIYGQTPIGLTNITSYLRRDYNGGLQNRTIVQGKDGILYFANSEGLLSFDGTYWNLYPLPNRTIVRSVAIGIDQKIYVGGQSEFGYFSPDKNGNLAYTSLKKLLKGNADGFKDIWNIIPYGNQLFFRSQSHIFRLEGQSLTDYLPGLQWQFLGSCNGELIVQDAGKGLLKFSSGKWVPLSIINPMTAGYTVTSLLAIGKDSILITTLKNGLFILSHQKLSAFHFKAANPFLNQLILSAILIDDNHIAIGTQMDGVYIIDKQGRVTQSLNRKEGLQNNTILGLFLDKDHNLWMGLDDGIDFNAYNSAIKHIYPERLNEGTGYSAILHNQTLYIGTSNGLYQLPVGNNTDLSKATGQFRMVENTKGPCWGLYEINHDLLMAHHEGAFQIKKDKAIPIDTRFGYWNFTAFDKNPPASVLIAGNYNGLDLINFDGNTYRSNQNINFSESARSVILENKTAWVAHNYKGIFKIDLSLSEHPVAKLYTDKNGLPSKLKNRLFKIKNRTVVATEKGIYEYNNSADRFEPSAYFRKIFKQNDVRYLKEDSQGNIWFIEEKKLGVVDFSGQNPQTTYFPELNGNLVSDFENIYPLNEENILVGAEKGFYHINYKRYKGNKEHITVLLRTVKASGSTDSILNGGYLVHDTKKALTELNSKQNNLHFEFSSPSFQNQLNIEYSYYLEKFDNRWSNWSKKTERDFTNLPAGNYKFQIKARSNLGNESQIVSYSFIILPPWYLTKWAYAVYALLFITFNYLFYRGLKKKFIRQKIKFKEEQKRLNYLHQLELEKSEKEIIALKNEKLESEIIGKNSELASVAMHMLQKSELLSKIKEELVHLRNADNDMPSEELKRLIRIINQESKMDKDWEQFAVYFDNTQSDFLKAVRETHPLLSNHELKLCAYLRMNLSSKEIAQLLNISVRGVEIGRYRLRKKLALPKEMNLNNYFANFYS
jgi:ligand-binding sensor domain-containing protein/DNA-binding CsgD family transcriptional regulator